MTDRISTSAEATYAFNHNEEDCGRVTHGGNLDCEIRANDLEDLQVYLLAGYDLEHVEEYRKGFRAWLEENEGWLA